MGANHSKNVSAEETKEIMGKGQQLQFKFNFWPEPIRKAGTTHSSKEHAADLGKGVTESCGTSLGESGHNLDVMVAAVSAEGAPSGRLFLYGMAHYGSTGDEKRAEAVALTYDKDSNIEGVVRYTDYFSKDNILLKDSSSLTSNEHKNASALKAELTSAPDTPNDDARKVRMQKAVSELLANWKDSPETSLKARASHLPWKRTCAGDALEKAVTKYCAEDCTLSMPLQQITMKAKDLPNQWRARLNGEGPFVHFAQTEVFVTSQAYAGHHPIGFAQFVMYSASDKSGQHHASNGILVAEFDDEGKKIIKLIMFRDHVSNAELRSVIIPTIEV